MPRHEYNGYFAFRLRGLKFYIFSKVQGPIIPMAVSYLPFSSLAASLQSRVFLPLCISKIRRAATCGKGRQREREREREREIASEVLGGARMRDGSVEDSRR
jgi:hypothetical protein